MPSRPSRLPESSDQYIFHLAVSLLSSHSLRNLAWLSNREAFSLHLNQTSEIRIATIASIRLIGIVIMGNLVSQSVLDGRDMTDNELAEIVGPGGDINRVFNLTSNNNRLSFRLR